MRTRIVLFFCILPFLVAAKSEDKNALKYLEGAVPEVKGKVVFTTQLNVQQLDEDTIFYTIKKWAEKRFKPQREGAKSRILMANDVSKQLAAAGDEYIIFSTSVLTLDRAETFYHFIVSVEGHKVSLSMQRVKYLYEVERGNRDYIYAEDWITDKEALNKKKTKLYPSPGKFRRKTIDLKDELFAGVKKVLSDKVLDKVVSPENFVTESKEQKGKVKEVITKTASASIFPGYKQIQKSELSSLLLEQLEKEQLHITAVVDRQVMSLSAKWKGMSVLFNRPIASCTVERASLAYPWIEKSKEYTLSFSVDKSEGVPIYTLLPSGTQCIKEANLIMVCKQVSKQLLDDEKTPRTLFMGEIKTIWIKKK